MTLKWCFFSVGLLTTLATVQAQAAVVAVMPVQGTNLSQGQCDAIGVLFANAFARETNVSVASPLDTRPLLGHARTPQAVAAQLGAAEFVDLRAVQLDSRVTLAGIRYGKEGNEIFRSETSAASMDEMETAAARLARALAWRQAPSVASMPAPQPVDVPPEAAPTPAPVVSPKALGLKVGLIFPRSSTRSYGPMMSLQFDGRFGTRNAFVEIGAGAAIPTTSSVDSSTVQMGGVFAELGGSLYLTDSNVSPYLGAGVSPRLWIVDDPNADAKNGATCAVYGQFGVTFTRDSRARLYAELRVSQYVLGISETQSYSTSYSSSTVETIYPTEFAMQFGIGW
jgi:hypothetical protein